MLTVRMVILASFSSFSTVPMMLFQALQLTNKKRAFVCSNLNLRTHSAVMSNPIDKHFYPVCLSFLLLMHILSHIHGMFKGVVRLSEGRKSPR